VTLHSSDIGSLRQPARRPLQATMPRSRQDPAGRQKFDPWGIAQRLAGNLEFGNQGFRTAIAVDD